MSIETLTDTILNQMPKMPKRSRIFFSHLMRLLLSLRGRFNFVNLARYGIFNEATYRYHFGKAFNFMTFNQHLIASHCSADRVIAFDPSYLPKSGKRTAGLGYFWSGCRTACQEGFGAGGFFLYRPHPLDWPALICAADRAASRRASNGFLYPAAPATG